MTKEELMAYIEEHGDARKVLDTAKQMRDEGVELTRENLDARLKPVDNALQEFVAKNQTAIENFEAGIPHEKWEPVSVPEESPLLNQNLNGDDAIASGGKTSDLNAVAIVMAVLSFVGWILINSRGSFGVTTVNNQIHLHISVLGYVGIVLSTIIPLMATWKIFEKAGEAGWKSLIPIYGGIVEFRIIWGIGWTFWLLLIPFFNIYWAIRSICELGARFQKGTGFKVGLVFLSSVFMVLLGFDDSEYI